MSEEESVEPGKFTVDEKKEKRRMSRREYLCLGAEVAVDTDKKLVQFQSGPLDVSHTQFYHTSCQGRNPPM